MEESTFGSGRKDKHLQNVRGKNANAEPDGVIIVRSN